MEEVRPRRVQRLKLTGGLPSFRVASSLLPWRGQRASRSSRRASISPSHLAARWVGTARIRISAEEALGEHGGSGRAMAAA